jgi:hypothetical protein
MICARRTMRADVALPVHSSSFYASSAVDISGTALEERPSNHRVNLTGLWINRTLVTNRHLQQFVRAATRPSPKFRTAASQWR